MKFFLSTLAFLIILISCKDRTKKIDEVPLDPIPHQTYNLPFLVLNEPDPMVSNLVYITSSTEIEVMVSGSCLEYIDAGNAYMIYNHKRTEYQCVYYDSYYGTASFVDGTILQRFLAPSEKNDDGKSFRKIHAVTVYQDSTTDYSNMTIFTHLSFQSVELSYENTRKSTTCVPQLAIDRGYFENGLPIEVDGICEVVAPIEVMWFSEYVDETHNYEYFVDSRWPPLN